MPFIRRTFSPITGNDPYTTTFPATENPISEGGKWTVGDLNGISVSVGPQTTGGSPGKAYSSSADGVDYVATRQGIYTANKHFAQATVRKAAGYTPPDTQEVELHCGLTLASNSVFTYECTWGFGLALISYTRWDGTFGNYTPINGSGTGSNTALADGDVIRFEFDATNSSSIALSSYKNGVLVYSATDTSAGRITSGNPGFGFFVRNGTGVDLTGYCLTSVTVGSL